MNTENDIKEFGFRHISINTVYNGLTRSCVQQLTWLVSHYIYFIIHPYFFAIQLQAKSDFA